MTLLFLIKSRLFIERGIDYKTMADVFTEDFIHTFFQGNVQIALPEATAENLATEGIEHQCDLGGFM